ncbi:hypothetical protein [Freshwater macrophyte associated hepe-like virus 1]|nr:hypothetical protein [Freshwater macrophyte associated hepe-like virus 1]
MVNGRFSRNCETCALMCITSWKASITTLFSLPKTLIMIGPYDFVRTLKMSVLSTVRRYVLMLTVAMIALMTHWEPVLSFVVLLWILPPPFISPVSPIFITRTCK